MSELMDIVREMEGKSKVGRGLSMLTLLENYPFETHTYVRSDYQSEGFKCDEPLRSLVKDSAYGVNFILHLGAGEKQIIITAHHDAVAESPGANDNASGVAVCLGLYKKLLKEHPVPNSTIKIIIFDDEEETEFTKAQYGAKRYIEKCGKDGVKDIACVYNLDCCGLGDVIGVWPVRKNKEGNTIYRQKGLLSLVKAAHKQKTKLALAETDKFYGAAHPFIKQGIEAFCLTSFSESDLKKIEKKVIKTDIFSTVMYYFSEKPDLLKYYHTINDKSNNLNEESLQRMVNVMYRTVVNLDKSLR